VSLSDPIVMLQERGHGTTTEVYTSRHCEIFRLHKCCETIPVMV